MSIKRFQQLKRFLHISRLEADMSHKQQPKDKRWWYKLEPLASLWESAAQRYYQVGSNLFIDETMIRCFGRSSHTIKMPSKPIEKGYKIFALAEHGYIWAFTVGFHKFVTGMACASYVILRLYQQMRATESRKG